MSGVDLLFAGNALVDVYASFRGPGLPAPQEARHIGSAEMAALLASLRSQCVRSRNVRSRSGRLRSGPVYSAGGGAANAAKIAGLLGVTAGFAGAVGAGPSGKGDEAARFFEAELRGIPVKTFLSLGKNPTGSCVILRDGGSIACPGAATELSAKDLPPLLIRNALALVLDGYTLPAQDLTGALLAEAAAGSVPVAIDSGAPFIVRDLSKKLLDYAATLPLLLFMNEEEAAIFTGLTGFTPEQLTKKGPFPIVVIKKEAQGAEIYAEGNVIRAKTRPLAPLESTGAGDAFCGAFMSAWIQKRPLAECAALANEAAGIVLSIPGTAIDSGARKQFAALKKKYAL